MNHGRKNTGGKYHANRKKKKFERSSQESIVTLGETKAKKIRGMGGNKRTILLKADSVNLLVKGKVVKTAIKNVLETPQNRFLARQNRLMKGVIIQTEMGKAKITNRPTREGHINATLIAE